MTINGKTASFIRDEERAQATGHDPVIVAAMLKTNDGVYPTGLILTRGINLAMFALVAATAEAVATGDGNTKAYTHTTAALPLEPGTVSVTDGAETLVDDGCGRLVGSAGGSGTVNYPTGAIVADFNANAAAAAAVTCGYITAVDGVLDTQADTTAESSGNVIIHGTVNSTVLKVGVAAPAAPTSALQILMQKHGIYPK